MPQSLLLLQEELDTTNLQSAEQPKLLMGFRKACCLLTINFQDHLLKLIGVT